MLVQPATVDRWHREGFRRWWRRRSRRPGRPRIDSPCRDLIRRMAAANCLWGAPRIHGELLKLGIAFSERTVSRYLRGRPTTRSQTWRTFFANHLADRTFIWPSSSTPLTGRPAPFHCRALGRAPPLTGRVSIGIVRSNAHLVACVSANIIFTAQARTSTGRDPPVASEGCNWPYSVGARFPCLPAVTSATDGCVRPFDRASSRSADVSLASSCNRVVNVVGRPNTSFGPPCWSATRFARRSEYWRGTGIAQALEESIFSNCSQSVLTSGPLAVPRELE